MSEHSPTPPATTPGPTTNIDSPADGVKKAKGPLLGAIFLMATSAIGPGFLTQTANFTAQLGAAFAFAILASIVIDIAVQLNVWRVIGISGLRASELGNRVAPGLGWFLTLLVCVGGLVFNIGNIAGAGLGTNAFLGVDAKVGGTLTAGIAIAFFLIKRLGLALDYLIVGLGVLMIGLTVYVAVVSQPPVGEALRSSVLPDEYNWLAVTTLVGGTVGGYITYAGAHRLLDSGQTGPEHVREVSRSSVTGIILTGIMRIVLFLAVLGVVAAGTSDLSGDANPAGAAFRIAAGEVGFRFFGMVMWAAALSSIIGASYTSASFLVSQRPDKRFTQNVVAIVFIVFSCAAFVAIGTAPKQLLVFAGAFNGLVLPVGFTLMLYVALFRSKDLLKGYRYPKWLITAGLFALAIAWFLAVKAFQPMWALLSA